MNRLVPWRCISLLAALLLLSGDWANADPVGDFFKKVGHSISKAFQPQPTPHPTRKTTPASGEPASRESAATQAAPTPVAQPASAAPEEKAKGDMPYGIPVPGRKGMVTSPYLPEGSYIDVSAFAPGSAVKDPYTGKIFRVP
jgi:uncharacterized membrane protein